MPISLKSTAQLLARKYSWHTLGDNVTICTQNVNLLQERNLSKPIIKVRPPNLDSKIVNPTGVRRKRIVGLPSSIGISTSVAKSHAITEKIIIFKPGTKSKRLIEERMVLTQEIYKDYNEMAFEGMLPSDLSISWSGRLTSTAGITKMSTQTKGAKKVLRHRLATFLAPSLHFRSLNFQLYKAFINFGAFVISHEDKTIINYLQDESVLSIIGNTIYFNFIAG